MNALGGAPGLPAAPASCQMNALGSAPGLPAAPASCQMNALGGAPGLPAAPASCQMNAQAKDAETGFWTPTNSDSEEDELVLSMMHRTVPLYGHNGMDAPSIYTLITFGFTLSELLFVVLFWY